MVSSSDIYGFPENLSCTCCKTQYCWKCDETLFSYGFVHDTDGIFIKCPACHYVKGPDEYKTSLEISSPCQVDPMFLLSLRQCLLDEKENTKGVDRFSKSLEQRLIEAIHLIVTSCGLGSFDFNHIYSPTDWTQKRVYGIIWGCNLSLYQFIIAIQAHIRSTRTRDPSHTRRVLMKNKYLCSVPPLQDIPEWKKDWNRSTHPDCRYVTLKFMYAFYYHFFYPKWIIQISECLDPLQYLMYDLKEIAHMVMDFL
ncbi:MAG: hypothetical protein Sylvanvirus6_7 [Sylvanvirus sp.]|uniref:Uncharacterized protein n=1 Tax=Sylvanvirus sp. TaxID=2487774 RepID=A0A3G5AHN7_9VIRU|nr:MAG: hypothetical protein Sylvanvirus6_7 [Sylvanvirus sp.]